MICSGIDIRTILKPEGDQRIQSAYQVQAYLRSTIFAIAVSLFLNITVVSLVLTAIFSAVIITITILRMQDDAFTYGKSTSVFVIPTSIFFLVIRVSRFTSVVRDLVMSLAWVVYQRFVVQFIGPAFDRWSCLSAVMRQGCVWSC